MTIPSAVSDEKEADKIGILSHEEDEADKNGALPTRRPSPKRRTNKAKSTSAQTTAVKGVTSENGSASAPDRSQFPFPLGGDDVSDSPTSKGWIGDSTSLEEAIQPDGFSARNSRKHDGRSRRADLDGSTTERLHRPGRGV